MPIDATTHACESPNMKGIAGRTEPISVATAITTAFRMLRAPSERYCPAPIPTVAATAIPIAAARILGARCVGRKEARHHSERGGHPVKGSEDGLLEDRRAVRAGRTAGAGGFARRS